MPWNSGLFCVPSREEANSTERMFILNLLLSQAPHLCTPTLQLHAGSWVEVSQAGLLQPPWLGIAVRTELGLVGRAESSPKCREHREKEKSGTSSPERGDHLRVLKPRVSDHTPTPPLCLGQRPLGSAMKHTWLELRMPGPGQRKSLCPSRKSMCCFFIGEKLFRE